MKKRYALMASMTSGPVRCIRVRHDRDGSGAILGTVTSADGVPKAGITVESSPLGAGGPFYDGDGAFTVDRTGSRGVFFVPGVAFGSADLTFSSELGTSTLVNGVSVINGGITILDSVVMP